jgi:solute carrier family 25 phosphate transporter 23/24/25/41
MSIFTSSFRCLAYRDAIACPGITLQPSTLSEFMNFLSSSPHPQTINFSEFRDFLILMPRKASTVEIYRYYEFRKNLGDDGHGNARVNMEGQWRLFPYFHADPYPVYAGDVSLSAEDRPGMNPKPKFPLKNSLQQPLPPKKEVEEEHRHSSNDVDTNTAFKFLLAGGIAGAGLSQPAVLFRVYY